MFQSQIICIAMVLNHSYLKFHQSFSKNLGFTKLGMPDLGRFRQASHLPSLGRWMASHLDYYWINTTKGIWSNGLNTILYDVSCTWCNSICSPCNQRTSKNPEQHNECALYIFPHYYDILVNNVNFGLFSVNVLFLFQLLSLLLFQYDWYTMDTMNALI